MAKQREFDDYLIRRVVYSLIDELRYMYKEDYINRIHNEQQNPKSSVSVTELDIKWTELESRLLHTQSDFESWLKEQKDILEEIRKIQIGG